MTDLHLVEAEPVGEGIVVVTLNEPQRRNPLSVGLVRELTSALRDLEAEPACRVVVLRGAGQGFCAGADRRRMAETTALEDRAEVAEVVAVNRRLWEYSKPTVAAVHGFAVGGGVSLMASCDVVVVEESTRIALPELATGLPAATVVPTLLRTIGRRATLDMVLTAADVPPQQAREWGLVSRVVPTGEALATALELAQGLATHEPAAVTLTKDVIRTATDLDHDSGLDYAEVLIVLARAARARRRDNGGG